MRRDRSARAKLRQEQPGDDAAVVLGDQPRTVVRRLAQADRRIVEPQDLGVALAVPCLAPDKVDGRVSW